MEQEKKDLTPADATEVTSAKKTGIRFSAVTWILIVCLLLVAAVLLTYTLTSAAQRKKYTEQLLAQQTVIDNMTVTEAGENLSLLESVIRQYSYYANALDDKKMLEAAFKAYVQASGDRYAVYYTEEEYTAMIEKSLGENCGIGVSVIRSTVTIGEEVFKVFEVADFHVNTAQLRGLCMGDLIYAICQDDEWQTVNSLDYDAAMALVGGEEGTEIKIRVFRPKNGIFESVELSLMRVKYDTQTVTGAVYEKNPKIGIVRISSFEYKTPQQFKTVVNELLLGGVEHFVLDVRSNPGGDLRSIMAVLSYFLAPGDLVIQAIDREGKIAETHTVQPVSYSGNYASCSVFESEIGMYAGLSKVVLCDENTASAAEVFTATMRDYGLAKTVGQKTFGKGIMQTTRKVQIGDAVGYMKLTTHAYVTKCGVSYHDIGIKPDLEVLLDEQAKTYAIAFLPQSMDAQLQTATTLFDIK